MGALLDRWAGAKSEIKLYDGQLVKITETSTFKRMAGEQAPASTDEKTQLFRSQTRSIFEGILSKLDVNGLEISGQQDSHIGTKKRSGKNKDSLSKDTFEYLKEQTSSGHFKSITPTKLAIKIDKKDYEVSISAHRTNVVDILSWKGIVIEGKIPPYVQNLSNYMINLEYDILLIKSNQITFLIDGSQYSIRFTSKTKLF